MAHWCSLYLRCADSSDTLQETAAQHIREWLRSSVYESYDPFALMPAMAYPRAVKLFVSPPTSAWIRVIGAGEAETTRAMIALASSASLSTSPFAVALLLALDETSDVQPIIDVYTHSEQADPASSLQPYARANANPESVRRALHDPLDSVLPAGSPAGKNDSSASPQVMVVTPDMLPEDIRGMAGSISANQANSLASRLGANLLGKAGGSNAGDAARNLLQGQQGVDWNSDPAARRIRALAQAVDLPDDWRTPDYVPLRDAYQLHARKRRNPAMSLLPGDAEAMAAVPNALTYTPVFAGKR